MKNKMRTLSALLLMLCLMALLPLQTLAAAKASIKLNKTKVTIEMGETIQLIADVTGKSQKVTWTSSNKKIVKVDRNGNLTPVKAGKATIKAKANGKTKSCTVTVKNVDYRKLYKKFLEQSTIKVSYKSGNYTLNHTLNSEDLYYYILNIDKKGVPELVICPMNQPTQTCCTYYVYTVKNNKVKYLGTCSYFGRYDVPPLYYSSKQKAIVSNAIGMGYESHGLYGISGYKLKTKRVCEESYRMTVSYRTGSKFTSLKTVSKKSYNTYYKKYFKSLKKYTMKANTEANRAKILK